MYAPNGLIFVTKVIQDKVLLLVNSHPNYMPYNKIVSTYIQDGELKKEEDDKVFLCLGAISLLVMFLFMIIPSGYLFHKIIVTCVNVLITIIFVYRIAIKDIN